MATLTMGWTASAKGCRLLHLFLPGRLTFRVCSSILKYIDGKLEEYIFERL